MSIEKETVKIGDEKVVIDPANLHFNENTLGVYITQEGGWYDNFGGYLAKAEKLWQLFEIEADELYAEHFARFKEMGGGTDKVSESKAKSHPDVKEAKQKAIEAKYAVTRLKNHLRAWDKNHDNAQSLGHFLRKEMDKLNGDIKGSGYYGGFDDVEDAVDQVIKHVEK